MTQVLQWQFCFRWLMVIGERLSSPNNLPSLESLLEFQR